MASMDEGNTNVSGGGSDNGVAAPSSGPPPGGDHGAPEDPDLRNLIVNYLPYTIDTDGLRALFAPHCTVETCRVILDRATGQPLGYGFVLAATSAGAHRAAAALTGHEIGLKRLKVGLAVEGRRENTHVLSGIWLFGNVPVLCRARAPRLSLLGGGRALVLCVGLPFFFADD
jgi:RNA recognition motif-containing protein